MIIYAGKLLRNGERLVGVYDDATGQGDRLYPIDSDSFDWGSIGQGASDLAHAILGSAAARGLVPQLARSYHDDFKREFIVRFRVSDWRLDGDMIAEWWTRFSAELEPVRVAEPAVA